MPAIAEPEYVFDEQKKKLYADLSSEAKTRLDRIESDIRTASQRCDISAVIYGSANFMNTLDSLLRTELRRKPAAAVTVLNVQDALMDVIEDLLNKSCRCALY